MKRKLQLNLNRNATNLVLMMNIFTRWTKAPSKQNKTSKLSTIFIIVALMYPTVFYVKFFQVYLDSSRTIYARNIVSS